jgi:hypothetical protein
MRESLSWLDQAFATTRTVPPEIVARGPWIMLLVAAIVLLARPLATWLPRIADPAVGAGLNWRRLWVPLLLPMLATPLLLRVLPTRFLPVVVGDYLAAHFAMYGLLTTLCLVWARREGMVHSLRPSSSIAFAGSWLAITFFGFIALDWSINSFVTSFFPSQQRILLLMAMSVGTLAFFLSDEWMTRGDGAGRGAYVASKIAFLVSLAIAVALDFERLFFLIIIVPVILLLFLIYGLFSTWAYRHTGHPFVAGIASALAFAWAIGVTFPLMAG